MTPKDFFQHIRELLAKDELNLALAQLQQYLSNSPKLDEVIQQSGRFVNIRKQIRLGMVSHAEATLNTNQVRMGIIDLVSEIESTVEQQDFQLEAQQATSAAHNHITQNAEKIYNIDHIDNANFS
ncbi:MAG: hypothetical protein AAFO82_14390 [Bacteroidota bacterium]